jgi:multidrug efflux system outer membrane protein
MGCDMMRFWGAYILIGLALVGCSLTPEYERPEVPVLKDWRVPSEDQRSLADLAWWDLFQDEALKGLIRTALEQNKDLRLAVARIQEARGALKTTRADQYPQLDMEASGERKRPSREISPGAKETDTFGVAGALAWELDLWGELRSASRAAQAELLAAENVRRGVIVSLVGDVARAYFELRDLDNRLAISKRTLEAREEALKIAQLRFRGGLTAETEVRQSEVELAKAQSVVAELEGAIVAKENELNILLGENPGDIRRGLVLGEQAIPPQIPAGLPSELLERRPDIREAEQQLMGANARLGVAIARRYPSIRLTGAYGVASNELSDILRDDAVTWAAGLDLLAPVFDAGRRQANVEVARAQLEQALIRYEQTVQQAFREVSDALSAHERAREVEEAQARLVEASAEYLRLASLQYRNGVVMYLDVLDAQRQLFDAELSRSESIRNQLTSLVQIYRALGGGWMPAADEPIEAGTGKALNQTANRQ